MLKKLSVTLFLISLVLPLFGQEPIRVALNERMEDDKIQRSLAILPVYVYQGPEIEPFTFFGVNPDKKEEQQPLVIQKMPVMENMRDTGYTYIYFSGANNDQYQGYCLTLIGNFKRSRKTVYFFIDRNNNLDFTDDGAPDSLTYMNESVVIALKNVHDTSAEHQLRLTRFKYGENIRYKRLLTEHFKKHSGGKKFSNINYCYREQRLNTVGGNHISATDSFTLALKDMNNDGIFNESCLDMVYIGALDEQIRTEQMSFILPDYDDIYFEWNKKRYQVKHIDPTGKFIDIQEVKNPVLTKTLRVGKPIPSFSFINLLNQKEEIKDYKKKETYIFFWDEESVTDEDTAHLNRLHREYADRLNIITLNHGDGHTSVRKYQYYNAVAWPMAFSSYQIGTLFYLEALPKGIYTRKRLKLVNDDMSPKAMYDYLRAQPAK
jgi:hypothetical protein